MSAGSLSERLAARIAHHGPMPVSEWVEAALYDELDGFYATGGRAGRGGDFLTAPEVGPLFGAVIARAVDGWWAHAGRPDRFTVVEHGAGPGTLVRSVLAAEPECLTTGALAWAAVDRAASQLAHHPVHPAVVSATTPPPGPADLVLANELLDNLPFDVVERTDGGWIEVLVDHVGGDRFATVPGPSATVDLGAVGVAGTRLPVPGGARRWLAGVLATGPGRVVVLDYGAPTAVLGGRGGGWLRTHRAHGSADWLVAPGSCDITADVDLDQLQADHPATTVGTQAEFLRAHGIDELVAAGRAAWHDGAATGGLAALRGRSRVREAEALLDPGGMGAFAVLEWVV